MGRLPQELLDMILDNIHDDIPSLKSCSLSARTFVASARKHIFRRIEINPPRSPSTQFYRLLSSSSHIAPLVEDLCVVLLGFETSLDRVYPEEDTWVMSDGTLPLVLALLKLKRISIVMNSPENGIDDGPYLMEWTKLGRQLKSALKNTFSSPRLEAVHLRGIVVESPLQLLSLFSEATALTEMSLSRVYFTQQQDEREPWPESRPWRPLLRSLLVSEDHCASICRYFVSPRIDLTHVRTLAVTTDSIEWRNKILQATKGPSGGIEDLRLWQMQEGWSQEIFSTNLRSIHMLTPYLFDSLGAIFNMCPQDTRLEHITIEVHGFYLGIPARSEFDATIEARVDHVCALKLVEVCIVTKYSHDPFLVSAGIVEVGLPSLSRRGMLRITKTGWTRNDVHQGWE